MKKRGNIQKLTSILLVFVMLLGVMLQSKPVFAEGLERVETKITEFTVTKSTGEVPPDGFKINDFLKLSISWDASYYQNELKEGDYFNITLPDEFRFPTNHAACNFDILDPNGTDVVAKAVVTPGTPGGGNIKVTFTKYVEDRYDIKGSMYLNANFNTTIINTPGDHEISIAVASYPFTITVPIAPSTPQNPLNNEILNKWVGQTLSNEGYVRWTIRINHRKGILNNVVITDQLTSESGDMTGIEYVEGNFKLEEVEMDEYGNVGQVLSTTDISDQVVLSPDKTSFTYNMGNIENKHFILRYNSTYREGLKLKNRAKLEADGESVEKKQSFFDAGSGGQGSGDLLSKIKIVKVDADNIEVKLPNAEFLITKVADNTTFTLTTGANGEALSEKLIPGTYKIKETGAPAGYLPDTKEYTVEVTSNDVAIQTIKNTRIKMSIPVTKTWVGPAADSVTVQLFANGIDTGKTLVLNAAVNWKGSFDDLPTHDDAGIVIAYTVTEEAMGNYTPAIAQNNENDITAGFTITNTNTETISIPVEKKWVGPAAESVTVQLFANGSETGKTLVLDAAVSWKGSFTDLPKYDSTDGDEIFYTVEERIPPTGYTPSVTPNPAGGGFTITNTNTETVSIPVTKQWVGTAAEKAVIELLADGVAAKQTELNEAGGWTYTFADLPKYDSTDGHEIVYTLKEVVIDGYTSKITGNMTSGFTVTNTNTETVSIPVTKQWVGTAAEKAVIELLADGAVAEQTELNAAGGWTHSFTNLPKYDPTDGHEIVYTLEEVTVPGYSTMITGSAENGFTITNTIEGKVSVGVTKKWVGPAAESVTVKLMNGAAEVAQQVLSKANNWQHVFADLDKYDAAGNPITYTLVEETVPGYSSEITGDMTKGFVVTNSNAARITIPVKKQWVGTAAAEVTVRLMDGAREVASKKLNAGNNWQASFADLPKYDGKGKEILYSIKEDAVEGYSTVISGNQTLGFTVTNTLTGKVSIPVTKVWKGTALERVTIHLLADGKEVAKQDLHKGNAWQHTFTDLEKYLNGKEINYSITEDPCPSYITEIVGTAQKGFVVTNSELTVPPTPPHRDPPPRIEKPTPKPTEKERKDASVLLPRTGEKADRFVYGLGLVLLALSSILLRKKLR